MPVTEAMVTRFQTIDADAPLSRAVSLLLSSDQEDFPVLRDGRLAGMLTRTRLLRVLPANQRDVPVHAVMIPTCEAVETSEMLDTAFRRMQESGCTSLPVQCCSATKPARQAHRPRRRGLAHVLVTVHPSCAEPQNRSG